MLPVAHWVTWDYDLDHEGTPDATLRRLTVENPLILPGPDPALPGYTCVTYAMREWATLQNVDPDLYPSRNVTPLDVYDEIMANDISPSAPASTPIPAPNNPQINPRTGYPIGR